MTPKITLTIRLAPLSFQLILFTLLLSLFFLPENVNTYFHNTEIIWQRNESSTMNLSMLGFAASTQPTNKW